MRGGCREGKGARGDLEGRPLSCGAGFRGWGSIEDHAEYIFLYIPNIYEPLYIRADDVEDMHMRKELMMTICVIEAGGNV